MMKMIDGWNSAEFAEKMNYLLKRYTQETMGFLRLQ